MEESRLFLFIFLAASMTILLSPLVAWFCKRVGLMDIPQREQHKQHRRPVPLAGGLILFVTFMVLSLAAGMTRQREFLVYLLPLCIIFVFGLVDDFVGLKPSVKFIGQILAAGLLISGGVTVQLANNQGINYLITLFWLVGITNAFNFTDSMDGLAVGLAAMAAAFLLLVTLQSGQTHLTTLSIIILGSCIGVYFFNAPPARYFLGDSGAQLLGFLLATIAVEYTPIGYTRQTSWFVPILLVGVPIFDTILVVFSRLRRKQPIYRANLDHTYHRLVRLGVSPNRAIVSMHLAAFLLDCIAFILINLSPVLANVLIAMLGLLTVGMIVYLDRPHLLEDNPYPAI